MKQWLGDKQMGVKRLMWAVVTVLWVTTAGICGLEETKDANAPRRLQEYLRYAALHNAGLKAAFENWKAALAQVPQAEALPDPRFNYGYFIEEVETRVGPQRHRFSISQVYPWFGTIEARTDAAAAAAKAARSRYEAKTLALFYEVKEAFYEYAYLGKAVEIAKANVSLMRHFEEVARAKYLSAGTGHPDVIRAQIELAKLEDKLAELEQLREPIVARLNAVLNRHSRELLPWPETETLKVTTVEREQVMEKVLRRNPGLKAFEHEIEAARSRVELARKKFYPDIGVGVDWIETGSALGSGVRDSGKDPVILMFSLNVPIWRDRYKAGELQAKASLRRVREERVEQENKLLARTETVLYELGDSARKAQLYGEILVPKAQELVEASEVAYRAGGVDFASLIDAQRILLAFELQHTRALTNNQQRLAELEMLAGGQIEVQKEDQEDSQGAVRQQVRSLQDRA